ncbi:Ribosomal RNA large subunit methyltransferase N, partial [human gut metagenome]
TRQDLIDWVESQGEKKFRASQIWEWLYRKRVQSFAEMTNISKGLLAKLEDEFVVASLNFAFLIFAFDFVAYCAGDFLAWVVLLYRSELV